MTVDIGIAFYSAIFLLTRENSSFGKEYNAWVRGRISAGHLLAGAQRGSERRKLVADELRLLRQKSKVRAAA